MPSIVGWNCVDCNLTCTVHAFQDLSFLTVQNICYSTRAIKMRWFSLPYLKSLLHKTLPYALGVILFICIGRETTNIESFIGTSEPTLREKLMTEDQRIASSLSESFSDMASEITHVATDKGSWVLYNKTFGNRTLTKGTYSLRTRNNICAKYGAEFKLNHTIYTNVFANDNTANDIICLITQLTNSRLHMLQKIAEHWHGSISATIYLKKNEYNQSQTEVKAWLTNNSRSNIAIHYMLEQGSYYPVNRLRNVAQDNTQAEFVFLIDVDFIPNMQLESTIQTYIDSGFFNSNANKMLIVPALEMMSDNETFPTTKSQLLKLARKRLIEIFHTHIGKAHGPTIFKAWARSKKTYEVAFTEGFEPYVVLKRELSPKYDERFLQRFFNKVSHIYTLNDRKFEFWVMPEGYLVHMPHEYDSKKSDSIYRCARTLWLRFKRELKLKSTHRRPVPHNSTERLIE